VYAEIVTGTGSATVGLAINGTLVGDWIDVEAGTPESVAVTADIVPGDQISFFVDSVGAVTALWLQTDGGAP
jgi:hypothetical protein